MKLYFLFIILMFHTFDLLADINSLTNKQTKQIDEIFSQWDKENAPGCALGIFQDGKLIYSRGYGMANLEHDIPNSSLSVFRIGSTSKQFTAASIVLLEEKRKLSFDDTLDKFFPDFPSYAKTISIRHLLNHTSGIRDYLTLSYFKGLTDNDYYTDKQVMIWLVNQSSLNFTPGQEFVYSNSGYWLLGQIVNQVAGMSMADFAEKEIFKPLGMTNTHFHDNHNMIVKNRASGYMPIDDDKFRINMTTLDMIGDGGVFTTIEDIKKWDDSFYYSKIFSLEFWKTLTKKGKLNNSEEIDYALGLFIGRHKGLKTISHGGAFVGYRAELLRFPDHKFSVAIFTNRNDANPTNMAFKVADVFLSDHYKINSENSIANKTEKKELDFSKDSDFTLEQMIGNYILKQGMEIKVNIQNNKLHALQSWNKSEYDLSRKSKNTYYIKDAKDIKFSFTKLEDNNTQKLIIDQQGQLLELIRKTPIDLTKINIEDYIGTFYSNELEVSYKVFVKDRELRLQIHNNEPVTLNIESLDVINYQQTLFQFSRVNNKVDGFLMNAGRVKNLKFTKIGNP